MRIINTYREPVPPAHVLTEREILSLCCEVVPVDECSEVGRVGVYEGAKQEDWSFDPDKALAEARAAYPRAKILAVRVEAIGPPTGTACGHLYESWDGRNNCCDGVDPLSWDMDVTPDVLPHGSSIVIAWTGSDGRGVELSTTSNATWFPGGVRSLVGHGSSIELFAGETFCGATAITVYDGCSTAVVEIRSDLGQWVSLGPVCALPGYTNHVAVGGVADIRESRIGRFKQVENLARNFWCYNQLKCGVENGDPPELCVSDCGPAVCVALQSIRSPEQAVNTCMAYKTSEILAGEYQFLCDLSDGSAGVVHPSYATTFYCAGTSGTGGTGAAPLLCGLYFTTTDLSAYQWVC